MLSGRNNHLSRGEGRWWGGLIIHPTRQCPLWVKSRYLDLRDGCPLYPHKQTSDHSSRTPAYPARSPFPRRA
jgi:hypothetical protein